jgi:hypothetical protein
VLSLPPRNATTRAVRRRSLQCEGCARCSDGLAWYWTARLVSDPVARGGWRLLVLCPYCAEERFRHFSGRRTGG